MQGIYNLYLNNKLIHSGKNIITNSGKTSILNVLGGKQNSFIQSMIVGIGSTSATSSDTQLKFMVDSMNISTSIVDVTNEKIYYKSSLPVNNQYTIYEVGCYSSNDKIAQRPGRNDLLAVFDSASSWTTNTGTQSTDIVNNRIGIDSIKYVISASSTIDGYLPINVDLSTLDSTSSISLAYYASGLSNVTLRLKNDDSNYFYTSSLSTTNGYNIASTSKNSFSTTGTPDWSAIKQIQILASAGGSGGSISLDAIRYDTPNSDGLLLSRVVLGTPQTKLIGVTLDIEYVLELNL